MVANIAMHFSSLTLPHVEWFTIPWIATSTFRADFAFLLDPLTLVMLLVVTGVGFLIHLYSVGYMANEEGYWRFFAYLNLFMFFMLTLVLAENFLLMFVGWEGVGLASYLLIGFYFQRESAAEAGKKAFIVNRVGDFGFLLAMFLMIAHFGSLSFSGSSPRSSSILRCKAALSLPSRCCWCLGRPASRRRFRCMSGCQTRWKAPHRSRP